MRKSAISLCILALCATPAVSQIRVVAYNTLDGPTPGVHDNAADMQVIFNAIANQSVLGIAKRPGVIVLQEQTSTSHTNLANLLNSLFGVSTYAAAMPGNQPNDDRQAFVYDTAQVTLIGSASSIATGTVRPVIRAQFRPVGYNSPAANFWVYGAHLMSVDPVGRASQTAAMRANADTLPAGAHVIYAGDFNMQSNQEQAWGNMVSGTGVGVAIDPLNLSNAAQTWNNNASFASIHTQSTRVGPTPDNDGGATGGMDDRFDVQLLTAPMLDGQGLSLIPGSYRAFGNDGQRFNKAINSSPTIPLGAAVANALWDGSDHLPVVADYQVPARMGVTQTGTPPLIVIEGATATASFRVQNTAPVAAPAGADRLDYMLVTTGAGVGSFAGNVMATTPGETRTVAIDTSVPGLRAATVNFSSTSQAVEGGSASFSISTQVLAHAQPSFSPGLQQTEWVIDFGIRGLGQSVPPAMVSVHNIATASPASALEIDAVNGAGDVDRIVLSIGAGGLPVVAGSSRDGFVAMATTTLGPAQALYSIFTSDQDYPGANDYAPMLLAVSGRVALPGDANLDNAVNIADFSILGANFNAPDPQGWETGDFNHDGVVNIADFSILASNFNTSASSARFVPEPMSASVLGLLVVLRRRVR